MQNYSKAIKINLLPPKKLTKGLWNVTPSYWRFCYVDTCRPRINYQFFSRGNIQLTIYLLKIYVYENNGIRSFNLTIKKKLKLSDLTPFPNHHVFDNQEDDHSEEFRGRNIWGWWGGGTWIANDQRERLCRKLNSYYKCDKQDIGKSEKHVEVAATSSDEKYLENDLKCWDSKFVKVDHTKLFYLLMTASYLDIKSLAYLTLRSIWMN